MAYLVRCTFCQRPKRLDVAPVGELHGAFAVGRARSGPGGIVIAGMITPNVPIGHGVTAQIRVDINEG